MIPEHELLSSHTDGKGCYFLASLFSGDKLTWHLKKWIIEKRNLAKEDEGTSKKQNIIMLKVKFEYNINRGGEVIADRENVNTAATKKTRYTARGMWWRRTYHYCE